MRGSRLRTLNNLHISTAIPLSRRHWKLIKIAHSLTGQRWNFYHAHSWLCLHLIQVFLASCVVSALDSIVRLIDRGGIVFSFFLWECIAVYLL
jgi:hypothetical protein